MNTIPKIKVSRLVVCSVGRFVVFSNYSALVMLSTGRVGLCFVEGVVLERCVAWSV